MSDISELYAQAQFDKIHDERSRMPQMDPAQQMSPQQMRMIEMRKRRFEEMRRQRMQEMQRRRALERIKAQVVYSPVLTSPQKSGYEPMPPGLPVERNPRLGVPIGIDAGGLSPQDQAMLMAMYTGRR